MRLGGRATANRPVVLFAAWREAFLGCPDAIVRALSAVRPEDVDDVSDPQYPHDWGCFGCNFKY